MQHIFIITAKKDACLHSQLRIVKYWRSVRFPSKKNVILIIFFLLTVCPCHVTYKFQSESTLYSCLNVKELLSRSKRKSWSLSDCNWTRTHNHLFHKRTLNHLAKCHSYFANNLSYLIKKDMYWVFHLF